MTEERRLAVLRAIVEDYVRTEEPVGSKALVERHNLGVSPATIRNDMAALEEEGYIAQPHTSAGRVPTDKGYRLFVDRLSSVKPLSSPERRAIQAFLDGSLDLDDVVARTVRLLAQLTRQVAVVQYPSLSRSSVRHVEVVALGANRLLLVLITDTGRVEQRVVESHATVSDELVGGLRTRLNAAIAGVRLAQVPDGVEQLAEQFAEQDRPAVTAVVSALLEMVVETREERVVLAGASNLARFGQDFPYTIRPVLEALEEQVVLLRLVGEATSPTALTVRIGSENPEGLTTTAVVSTSYGRGDQALGGIGVLGPMRMDYPSTMGAVRAVARYVSQILAES
ncbi:heat-inducible transcriptional repressor HrcA [Motilibacter aurantiacus]|uniref:heat-inducible transcriptional repressor HrcA n=1 Tax=Motilibacter aurantiacus TaxID=2714955 RepID=UPI00140BB7FB|nr:heat-inducible transcriptional repressor HrcA [Motilibacter aurantiacus]